MSIQRSPPGTKLRASSTVPYGSDSALNKTSSEGSAECCHNITKRQKRNFSDCLGGGDQCLSELKSMLLDFKVQQQQQFESLNSKINVLVTQNQDIRQSIDFLSGQYDDLILKLNHIEKENNDYKDRVNRLERRLEFLERSSRSATIELRNLPKQLNENKQTIIDLVKKVGTTLCPDKPLVETDIKEIYRTKTDAIIVDFNSTMRKDTVLTSFKQFNKLRRSNKEPQLNTDHLKVPGPTKPIFISEVLTSKAGRLYYTARQMVKNKKIAYAWTSFGKVYVKKEEGQSPIRIEDEVELQRLDL